MNRLVDVARAEDPQVVVVPERLGLASAVKDVDDHVGAVEPAFYRSLDQSEFPEPTHVGVAVGCLVHAKENAGLPVELLALDGQHAPVVPDLDAEVFEPRAQLAILASDGVAE